MCVDGVTFYIIYQIWYKNKVWTNLIVFHWIFPHILSENASSLIVWNPRGLWVDEAHVLILSTHTRVRVRQLNAEALNLLSFLSNFEPFRYLRLLCAFGVCRLKGRVAIVTLACNGMQRSICLNILSSVWERGGIFHAAWYGIKNWETTRCIVRPRPRPHIE